MALISELRRSLFNIPAGKKVCRSLFETVDHDEIKADLKKEYNEHIQIKTKLWNFDFERNIPKDKENGLKWVACPTKVAEYTVKPGVSLITAFLEEEKVAKNSLTHEERHLSLSPNSVSEKLTSRLEENNTKEDKSKEIDEDCKIVRIVNISPTRPRLHRSNLNDIVTRTVLSTTNMLSCGGKRKRDSQPRIDDFMKKKKPRVSMDLSQKSLRKDISPISRRLRSSPSTQVSV